MTLEERVERLENFTGNIEKIKSVYANSVQEICDKYLNLLYIEVEDENHPNRLVLDGFLSDLTTVADVPHNVAFNVRPSHDFAYLPEPGPGDDVSKLYLKRDDVTLQLPLKKYDLAHPGNLIWLSDGDYKAGIMYSIYINSQNIAIISSSDAGNAALNAVERLTEAVEELATKVASVVDSQGAITMGEASIESLTITQALTISNPFQLPLGSTCSTPTGASDPSVIANKGYVDSKVSAEIQAWFNSHHLFGTEDPTTVLQDPTVPEKAIYYRYE